MRAAARAADAKVLAPLRTRTGAHGGDVWGVQLGSGPHGEVLSCGADGALVAWSSLGLGGDAQARDKTLVQLTLPINSLELSSEHGLLASASDEQVLTFLDMRPYA